MLRLKDFIDEIRIEMKRKKITQRDIARDLEFSEGMVKLIFSGKSGSFYRLNKIVDYVNNKE